MKLYVFLEDEKETRFFFRDVTLGDWDSPYLSFCPDSCDSEQCKEFESIKKALEDYVLPF